MFVVSLFALFFYKSIHIEPLSYNVVSA